MSDKILAVLEIADHEVRLIVGQFFNSRLNILKIEQVSHSGINNYRITNEELVIEAIRKAITNASKNLGSLIEKVILIVPGVNMKSISHEINITINERISKDDLQIAFNKLRELDSPEKSILINTIISKYVVNGIATRKVPIGENGESLTLFADLYYGDQDVVFEYVKLVEKSGIKILEIVLDDIAYAKEAALYEGSISQPKILVDISNQGTSFSIFYKGTLKANLRIHQGLDTFKDKLIEKYKIPEKVARKIIYDHLSLTKHSEVIDSPVFIWATKNQTNTITQVDLFELLHEDLIKYVEELLDTCEPTLQFGETELVVTGPGAYIDHLDTYIKDNSDFSAKIYIPTTYGCRDAVFTTVLGAFYYYKDQVKILGDLESSINMDYYMSTILKQNVVEEDIEESLTSKLRNIFK